MDKRLIVGVSGASGAPLAVELLRHLRDNLPEVETHLIVTRGGRMTLRQETGMTLEELKDLASAWHDNANIGAVGVADLDGKVTVTEFPGHKEGVVCEKWTAALATAGCLPAVVTAGIHYDGLDRAGIEAVLALTDELLTEALRHLAK